MSLLFVFFFCVHRTGKYQFRATALPTNWFPHSKRGVTTGFILMASVAAGVVGAPVSGAILQCLNGALILQGWQWLLQLQGPPTYVCCASFAWTISCPKRNGLPRKSSS